jgi:hypothetical protein
LLSDLCGLVGKRGIPDAIAYRTARNALVDSLHDTGHSSRCRKRAHVPMVAEPLNVLRGSQARPRSSEREPAGACTYELYGFVPVGMRISEAATRYRCALGAWGEGPRCCTGETIGLSIAGAIRSGEQDHLHGVGGREGVTGLERRRLGRH